MWCNLFKSLRWKLENIIQSKENIFHFTSGRRRWRPWPFCLRGGCRPSNSTRFSGYNLFMNENIKKCQLYGTTIRLCEIDSNPFQCFVTDLDYTLYVVCNRFHKVWLKLFLFIILKWHNIEQQFSHFMHKKQKPTQHSSFFASIHKHVSVTKNYYTIFGCDCFVFYLVLQKEPMHL